MRSGPDSRRRGVTLWRQGLGPPIFGDSSRGQDLYEREEGAVKVLSELGLLISYH